MMWVIAGTDWLMNFDPELWRSVAWEDGSMIIGHKEGDFDEKVFDPERKIFLQICEALGIKDVGKA